MKIEDLPRANALTAELERIRSRQSDVQKGLFHVSVSHSIVKLPGAHSDAIKALILSGLQAQVAALHKELAEMGVRLPVEG